MSIHNWILCIMLQGSISIAIPATKKLVIVDEYNKPVSYAQIQLSKKEGKSKSIWEAKIADSTGIVLLETYPEDTYQIEINKDGFLTSHQQIQINYKQNAAITLQLRHNK